MREVTFPFVISEAVVHRQGSRMVRWNPTISGFLATYLYVPTFDLLGKTAHYIARWPYPNGSLAGALNSGRCQSSGLM